jgi:hypothetical protein
MSLYGEFALLLIAQYGELTSFIYHKPTIKFDAAGDRIRILVSDSGHLGPFLASLNDFLFLWAETQLLARNVSGLTIICTYM